MNKFILILNKFWFDKIDSGKKEIEYRKYNYYWFSRIEKMSMFDIIEFRHGYQKNAKKIYALVTSIEKITYRQLFKEDVVAWSHLTAETNKGSFYKICFKRVDKKRRVHFEKRIQIEPIAKMMKIICKVK